MNGEDIFGVIIMTLVSLLCAGTFYGIGVWAQKRKTPMPFYSGTEIDTKTVSDIPAYNKANSKMWKQYSIPYWFCGLCSLGGIFDSRAVLIAAVMMSAACTIGIGWLLWCYRRIAREYIIL